MKRESQGKRKPPSLSPEIPVHLCHCADARMEPHLPALFWSIAQSHPTVSPLVHFICLGDDDAFPDRVTAAAARRGLSCKTYRPKTLPKARLCLGGAALPNGAHGV